MKKEISNLFFVTILLLSVSAFGQEGGLMEKIHVWSSAFEEGEGIPPNYTCDGADMSPPVAWSGIPSEAQSLAIIVDDPDAPGGDWVHWLLYDLSPALTQLPAGIPVAAIIPDGGFQGRTDFGETGYGGPCPPSGTHRYFFKVYALDMMLRLDPGATKRELLKAMRGHILAEGQLMGTYKRS